MTRHADEAARTQHVDTLAALQRAEDANTLAGATAKQQAADTAVSLGLSKQAADAATRAVDANVASERARIFVGKMTIKQINEMDTKPTIAFQIFNLGRTTALITGTSAECAVVDPPGKGTTPTYDQQRFLYAMSLIPAGDMPSIPGWPECALDNPITDADFAALANKTKVILFKGFVNFQDVFGEKFTQRFAYYSDGDKVDAFSL